MSSLANTRKVAGSSIKVDDLDSGFVEHTGLLSISMNGADADMCDEGVADSNIADRQSVMLVNLGDITVDFFDDLDDLFFAEMKVMLDGQEIRTFKVTMVEGTKKVGTFTAYVVQLPISAAAKNKFKTTLTLEIVTPVVWAAS